MQFLATTRDSPDVDWSTLIEELREEARRVWELQKAGSLRAIWFTDPERDAILLLEAESPEAAAALVESLPLVRREAIQYALVRLMPYDGYERLMK